MKIKQILLKNFATVNEIQIDLTDDVTYLIGENGSGKTMVGLSAIWFVLEGIAKTGKKVLHADRFRFIGKYGKSAIGQITLYDEKEDIEIYLQRKITKGATSLQIKASDDRDLGEDFVERIFNIFSINPEGFAMLSPKEQAAVLGVDTSNIDAKKKVAYDERRELGYAVKQTIGALDACEDTVEVKHVKIGPLLDKKANIDKDNELLLTEAREARLQQIDHAVTHNSEQFDLRMEIKSVASEVETLEEKLKLLKIETHEVKNKIALNKEKITKLPTPQPAMKTDISEPDLKLTDTQPLAEEIRLAGIQNQQALAWDRFIILKADHEEAVVAHDKKDLEYHALEQERIDYLKTCDLPFDNITINDNGELLVDGRPFSSPYFSKGEIIRAGVKMAAARSKELKYIFVPDAQSIDEKSREILFKELVDAGFQVVAELVGTEKKKGDNSILLRESQVVDSYEEKEKRSVL